MEQYSQRISQCQPKVLQWIDGNLSVPEIGPTLNSLTRRAANISAIFVPGGKNNTKTGHGKMQRSFLAITY